MFRYSFILYNCLKIFLKGIYKTEYITDNYSDNDINLFIMQPDTKVTSDYCIYIMNHYFFKKCGC